MFKVENPECLVRNIGKNVGCVDDNLSNRDVLYCLNKESEVDFDVKLKSVR